VRTVGREMPIDKLWRKEEFKLVDEEKEEQAIASSLVVVCRNCNRRVTLDKFKVLLFNIIGTP